MKNYELVIIAADGSQTVLQFDTRDAAEIAVAEIRYVAKSWDLYHDGLLIDCGAN